MKLKSFITDPNFRQYLAAFCWNFGGVNMGIYLGWSAVTTPLFQSTSQPALDEPLSDELISDSTSFPFLVGILFSCVWGYIANAFGRKIAGYLSALSYIICYALLLQSTSVEIFLLSRIIGGSAYCGVLFNGPMYIAEICETSKIGQLSATYLISENVGLLLIYIVGSVLEYQSINIFCFVLSFLSLVLLIFFPESPVYYLKKDQDQKAKLSLQWYRPNDEQYLLTEMKRLNDTFVLAKKIKLKYIFTKHTLMAVWIGLYLQWAVQSTGYNYLIMYAVLIFQHSTNVLDPYFCTILVGVMSMIGPFLYFYITNKFGRKTLLIASYTILCLIMAVLGAYFYYCTLQPPPAFLHFIPALGITSYLLVSSSGAGIIPYTLYSEIFSSEVRDVVIPFIYIWNGLASFLATKFFPTFFYHTIHLHGIFWVFSASSFLSIIFVAIFVPETKDKSFTTIVEELTKKAWW